MARSFKKLFASDGAKVDFYLQDKKLRVKDFAP